MRSSGYEGSAFVNDFNAFVYNKSPKEICHFLLLSCGGIFFKTPSWQQGLNPYQIPNMLKLSSWTSRLQKNDKRISTEYQLLSLRYLVVAARADLQGQEISVDLLWQLGGNKTEALSKHQATGVTQKKMWVIAQGQIQGGDRDLWETESQSRNIVKGSFHQSMCFSSEALGIQGYQRPVSGLCVN